MMRTPRIVPTLLVVVAGVWLIGAPAAGAHTTISGALPTAGQTVGGTVEHLRIDFFTPVRDGLVVMTSPTGRDVPVTLDADHGDSLDVVVDPLDVEGEYIVEWSVVTGDGDRQASAFAFTYDADAPQVAGTRIGGDHRGRTLATATAAGLALLALGARRGHVSHPRRRRRPWIRMVADRGN